MTKNNKEILQRLKQLYPNAHIELNYDGVFQLLVAVILSAQCTDKRVNMVTPALFKRFPDPETMATADIFELQDLVKSTGFFRSKAKNIKATSQIIMEKHNGEVPQTMEELIELPGVARKTANVVTWSGFGKSYGIVVDTHVMRLAGRLGFISKKLAESKNAVKIEQELCKKFPKQEWGGFSHLLILHGRRVCEARKPKCEECPLLDLCKTGGKRLELRTKNLELRT